MATPFLPRSRARAVAILIAASVGLVAAPAFAKVLAKVDGLEITDDDVKIALEDIGPTLPQQIQGPQREAYVLDYLIDMKLAAKKFIADKMAAGPEIVRKTEYYKDKVLSETVLGGVAKNAATDAEMKKVYDEAKSKEKPEEEAHARHILVPTENEAKDVLKRLKGGEEFAKVAKEVSKDPGSEGGDLGWFTKERMVPEFADAAFKLNKGQLSEPVKSQFGWHIIQLEDKRTKEFPPYDAVKEQIASYVAQKAQSDLIMDLRKGAKIERTEPPAPELPPAPAAGAPPKP
jgi:peptidyl-prolyl cis-trans isomerase C